MKALANNPLLLDLANTLSARIKMIFAKEIPGQDLFFQFSTPPKLENGHVAFASFILSKELKLPPPVVAQKLKENFETDSSPLIEKIQSAGPYLNFFLNLKAGAPAFLKTIKNNEYFSKPLFSNSPKTMIEYSQPNTHKELHVGHMRNLCLGDALVRLNRYAQVDTVAVTYPGDVGTHVAKCLWYLKKYNKEPMPTEKKGAWLGRLYTKSYLMLEDQKGSDLEDKNRSELAAILQELHAKKGEYFDLWQKTRQWSIDQMNTVYEWADVKFDRWFFESQVDEASLKLVDEYLAKGIFKIDDGAVGIDLSEDNLGFCLLRKRDGNGLYATKDLELAREKFNNDKIEKSLYVVDNRQSLHFKQVFKTLEKMGFPQAKNCFHLAYDFVELPDGAMSSRKGNIIALESLIEQMEKTIIDRYLSRYSDWSQEEVKQTARIIAGGAIKYGMLKIDNNKKIVFEMDEWLKLDGNSGPYLQYTYSRIRSIIKKSPTQDFSAADSSHLSHPLEIALLLKMFDFNSVVQQAVLKNSPSLMCHYLYESAQAFNSFYAECSILQAENVSIQKARLCLVDGFSVMLKNGLALLGIKSPERM